jgi:hypothetical protein
MRFEEAFDSWQERRLTQHPLIEGAKPLFEAGRLTYQGGYLRPAKKLLVDLAVSLAGGLLLYFASPKGQCRPH